MWLKNELVLEYPTSSSYIYPRTLLGNTSEGFELRARGKSNSKHASIHRIILLHRTHLTQTHMEICSPTPHPPNHDVGVHHPTIGRNTKAHPSRRTDVHCECNRTLRNSEVPVEHVRISIPVVESCTEGVPARKVTENEREQCQQTRQRPHCGGSALLQRPEPHSKLHP